MWREIILKYYRNIINWGELNTDKLLHILIMALFVALLKIICPLWIAIIIMATVGFIKEKIDNKLDWKDLVADAIGILLGSL